MRGIESSDLLHDLLVPEPQILGFDVDCYANSEHPIYQALTDALAHIREPRLLHDIHAFLVVKAPGHWPGKSLLWLLQSAEAYRNAGCESDAL